MTTDGAGSADAPCGCHAVAGRYLPESPPMYEPSPHTRYFTEGAWQNVVLGADAPIQEARGTLKRSDEHGRDAVDGPFLHAFLKFRLPGSTQVYMVRAHVDLRKIVQELTARLAQRTNNAVSGGRIARKMKHGIKRVAHKIAKSKIVAAVVNVAKKAWNNPLIKGIVSATPWGAAINATAAAARVAAKAIKGGKRAKATLASIAKGAKAGNPDALRAARLVKTGMTMTGIRAPIATATLQTAAAGGEGAYLGALLNACATCTPQYAQVPMAVGCGADTGDMDEHEIDALDTVATSGAFEGLRWIIHRLSLHSAAGRPDELGTKQLLLLGQQALEQRRH